ncbi:MAG: cobalt ECF transporter T component CbiQ [Planctomycetes bacterium]|nr:cobalt ECF transporter T component CbiQ [Planctomycetota bacterium]
MSEPWLARRDDRARLVAFGLLAAPLSALGSPAPLALGAAAGALVAATSGLPWRLALRRLAPVLALVVPVTLLTPFWAPPGARALFDSWPGGPTREGAAMAGSIALRALALGLLAVGAFAVPLPRTLAAASRLGAPAPLVHTALLSVRFVERLDDDLARAGRALRLRGFRPRPDLATSRTYAALTGALLVRSVARTERVEAAMRLRGYAGRLVLPPRGPFGPRDALLVLAAAGLALGLLLLDHGRGA